jgi:hypothetical protein
MSEPCFSSGQVAQCVGLPRWWFLYLLDKGLLPGPSFHIPGRRLFTDEDVRRIAATLEARPDLHRSERKLINQVNSTSGAAKV